MQNFIRYPYAVGIIVGTLLAIGLVLVGACLGSLGQTAPDRDELVTVTAQTRSQELWDITCSAILASHRSPDSVVFSDDHRIEVTAPQDPSDENYRKIIGTIARYHVHGAMRSQNTFGASIQQTFVVKVDRTEPSPSMRQRGQADPYWSAYLIQLDDGDWQSLEKPSESFTFGAIKP